ncbi:hypothetical protein [Nocardiopsis alborubida]|uniref:Uncharacterized protein n=1 Tax=Nocardiopsis alborubida TaxID=146802 RepID=A0A7X6RNP6_9ACTN|nr:hypothetical protein [Nocardiopsis alborubida]NKY96758.1 hypothetical protein [Nocardiopsis alborubida]
MPSRSWLPRPAPEHIRTPALHLAPWKAYALLAIMWAMSGGFALAQQVASITGMPVFVSFAGTVLALMLLFLAARGDGTSADMVGILPAWPTAHRPRRRWVAQWWATCAYAVLALLLGIGAYTALHLALPAGWTGPGIHPFAAREPFLHVVTVGAPVVLLGAAHRPTWEVYAVSAMATVVVFVVPFGVGSLAAALPVLVLVWLYRRTRRLTALIAAEAILALTTVGIDHALAQW